LKSKRTDWYGSKKDKGKNKYTFPYEIAISIRGRAQRMQISAKETRKRVRERSPNASEGKGYRQGKKNKVSRIAPRQVIVGKESQGLIEQNSMGESRDNQKK